MSQELIISISGMRGLIGENLFPEIASGYGSAFGTFLKKRHTGQEKLSVAIGREPLTLEALVGGGLIVEDMLLAGLILGSPDHV